MSQSYNSSDESCLTRDEKVQQLKNTIKTLQIAEKISNNGYLITSAELAYLIDVNASAVTSRGNEWYWRNWIVSRVKREGNQILWQLDKIEK